MKAGKILKSIKKKLSDIVDSLVPQAEQQLVPVPVRKRPPARR